MGNLNSWDWLGFWSNKAYAAFIVDRITYSAESVGTEYEKIYGYLQL